MFVTSEGRLGARLQRALAARNLTSAEQAAFEIAFISLEQARDLVELYAEKGDPKYERAALKYLARYMAERSGGRFRARLLTTDEEVGAAAGLHS